MTFNKNVTITASMVLAALDGADAHGHGGWQIPMVPKYADDICHGISFMADHPRPRTQVCAESDDCTLVVAPRSDASQDEWTASSTGLPVTFSASNTLACSQDQVKEGRCDMKTIVPPHEGWCHRTTGDDTLGRKGRFANLFAANYNTVRPGDVKRLSASINGIHGGIVSWRFKSLSSITINDEGEEADDGVWIDLPILCNEGQASGLSGPDEEKEDGHETCGNYFWFETTKVHGDPRPAYGDIKDCATGDCGNPAITDGRCKAFNALTGEQCKDPNPSITGCSFGVTGDTWFTPSWNKEQVMPGNLNKEVTNHTCAVNLSADVLFPKSLPPGKGVLQFMYNDKTVGGWFVTCYDVEIEGSVSDEPPTNEPCIFGNDDHCNGNDDGDYCSEDNQCVMCLTDDHCGNDDGDYCSDDNQCVMCLIDEHCSALHECTGDGVCTPQCNVAVFV